MLEMKNLKNTADVLKYIEEQNRKVKKTKLYEDINKGLLKKQADGTFKLRQPACSRNNRQRGGKSERKAKTKRGAGNTADHGNSQ